MIRKWLVAALLIAAFPGTAPAEVTLNVTSVQGGASLEVDFGTVRPLSPDGQWERETMIRQVRLAITSDSGRPYRVLQRVNGPWTGPGGKEIPMDAIRFSMAETRTGGSNRFPGPAPLSMGDHEIFLSDPAGSSDELILTYIVELPPGQRAGSYRTTISYQVVAQ